MMFDLLIRVLLLQTTRRNPGPNPLTEPRRRVILPLPSEA